MASDKLNVFTRIPFYLSAGFLLFWLVFIIIMYQFSFEFMVGLMAWVAFGVITAISWKDGLIGGILWLLAGGVYLVIALGDAVPFVGSLPIFFLGVTYTHQYFKEERMQTQSEEL